MSSLPTHIHLEGELGERLTTEVCNDLRDDRPYCGLRWSPRMSEDDPEAELLVIDNDGNEYVLEIDVSLRSTDWRAPR